MTWRVPWKVKRLWSSNPPCDLGPKIILLGKCRFKPSAGRIALWIEEVIFLHWISENVVIGR